LASQPSLSRFENSQDFAVFKRLNALLLEVAKQDLQQASEIVMDLDSTDDETHGKQQLSFFHGFYNQHMFHPLLVYANGKLIAVLLRPGNVHSGRGATALLRTLIRKIRSFTTSPITVRADAGFSLPRLYRMLEKEGIRYVIGLITNDKLRAYATRAMGRAQKLFVQKKVPIQLLGSTQHQAQSWSKSRRQGSWPSRFLRNLKNLRCTKTLLPVLDSSTQKQAQSSASQYLCFNWPISLQLL
jgi:hypothetical protein